MQKLEKIHLTVFHLLKRLLTYYIKILTLKDINKLLKDFTNKKKILLEKCKKHGNSLLNNSMLNNSNKNSKILLNLNIHNFETITL